MMIEAPQTLSHPKLFKKILIANRGEIALRILRACKVLNIETVAVYSEADQHSLHVKLANESVCIGKAASSLSYLHMPSILAAAEITGSDAIHPGYGFLSENATFAQLVKDAGFCFIGPSAESILAMGEKTNARKVAQKAGVPLLPGTVKPVDTLAQACDEAQKIGFPVILKAAGGGGGRGITMIRSLADLEQKFETARAEAKAAFNNEDVYLEKYCEHARHIEIQVLCDAYGHCVSLGERDCSIQRRHQKLIEESPSPIGTDSLREAMSEAALKLCKAVEYYGVGTVEFLLDDGDPKTPFYFMEMNTRIQVEHPVTECVTGIDLIQQQILVAAGYSLPDFLQSRAIYFPKGCHAIECRINAEHPQTFRPSPGMVHGLHLPSGPGVRVDTFIYQGYTVLPYYDSMIAKIITYGTSRKEAIARMQFALEECVIEGIDSNISFHQSIFAHKDFIEGRFTTRFLEHVLPVQV